jgi:hypothetical protein
MATAAKVEMTMRRAVVGMIVFIGSSISWLGSCLVGRRSRVLSALRCPTVVKMEVEREAAVVPAAKAP